MSTTNVRTTCGRCHVYRDLHPTTHCAKSRYSFWWDRHSLARHIAARIWLRLSDRRRMNLVHRYWSRNEHLCWCEFVDAALLDDRRDDYECGCDVPLPFGVKEPTGNCYCPTNPPADHEPAPEAGASGRGACPTCGPTNLERHPRWRGVVRCVNCKEWLHPDPTSVEGEVG